MDKKIMEMLGVFSAGFVGGYVIMALSSSLVELAVRLALLLLFYVVFRKYLETPLDKLLAEKLLNQ